MGTIKNKKKKYFSRDNIQLAFFLAFAIFGIIVGEDEEDVNEAGLNFKTLSKQEMETKAEPLSLDILPIHARVEANQIDEILSDKNADYPIIYSYDRNDGQSVYTMSTPSIERQHFLVNAYLQGYKPFDVDNLFLPMQVLAKRKLYSYDHDLYGGRQEVWQTSKQAFFTPRGDCEDHALILADWLIAMGEDARVVIGDMKGEGHAWVVLFKDGKEYLLEATQKSGFSRNRFYPLAKLFPDYHPQYMFNRTNFWLNKGSRFTSNYSSTNWNKMSRYNINSQPKLFIDHSGSSAPL